MSDGESSGFYNRASMKVRFDWNEDKNRSNIAKHGVGFDEARWVFSDPNVIIHEDRFVDGEERLHAIGNVETVLLVVHTFTEQAADATIRIISARKATVSERKLYEEGE